MATSGTTSWSLNRDQVITAALRKLGVIPSGGIASINQTNDAADTLNALVKTLQADGMPLWKVATTSFTTSQDQSTYSVGPGQAINCPKPIRIFQATVTPANGSNTPLNVYTRYDYNNLPQDATGTPVDLYYQPGRLYGSLRLWPTPTDSTTIVKIDYHSHFEDMSAADNDFDFPSEWITPLIYLLAWMMAPEFGVPPNDRMALKAEADYWHQYVLSMGSEEGSITIRPNHEG